MPPSLRREPLFPKRVISVGISRLDVFGNLQFDRIIVLAPDFDSIRIRCFQINIVVLMFFLTTVIYSRLYSHSKFLVSKRSMSELNVPLNEFPLLQQVEHSEKSLQNYAAEDKQSKMKIRRVFTDRNRRKSTRPKWPLFWHSQVKGLQIPSIACGCFRQFF